MIFLDNPHNFIYIFSNLIQTQCFQYDFKKVAKMVYSTRQRGSQGSVQDVIFSFYYYCAPSNILDVATTNSDQQQNNCRNSNGNQVLLKALQTGIDTWEGATDLAKAGTLKLVLHPHFSTLCEIK